MSLLSRLQGWLQIRRLEHDLDDELLPHVDMRTEDNRCGNVARGRLLRRATPLWQFDGVERRDARRGHCWVDRSNGPESSLSRADAPRQPGIHMRVLSSLGETNRNPEMG